MLARGSYMDKRQNYKSTPYDSQNLIISPHPLLRYTIIFKWRKTHIHHKLKKKKWKSIRWFNVFVGQIVGDPSQWLQIALDDRMNKRTRFFPRIPLRYIHHIRFHHHRPVTPSAVSVRHRCMERGHGAVVTQAVMAAHHAETHHVLLIVQDLKPLRAGLRRHPRHHPHLPESAHVAVADDNVAALQEVLVRLGVVEAPDDRPDGADGGVDRLHHGGAALVGPHRVAVVAEHVFRHGELAGNGADPRGLRLFLVRRRGGGGDVVSWADPLKLKRRRHSQSANSRFRANFVFLCMYFGEKDGNEEREIEKWYIYKKNR